MKNDRIVRAYDRIAPSRDTEDRILARVLQAEQAAPAPRRRRAKRLVLAAACVGLLAALTGVGYAAYQRWRLPEPVTYTTPSDAPGIYQIHETSEYTQPETQTQAPPLSDADFMLRAEAVLRAAGFETVAPERLTVTRQANLYWDREEAEVCFDQDGVKTTVTFDADSGGFLGLFGADWVTEPGVDHSTEADALAAQYYHSLPVPQDYVLQHREEYDDQYWSYDFCRQVLPDVFSEYEMVRVSINPVSGRLTGCRVFCVPLLDDHQPGETPISRQEAERLALALPRPDLTEYELLSAELTVGLPNWNFTQAETSANRQASKVTRLCWKLRWEQPNSEFADQIELLIDAYTGELLGGDRTG